MGADRRDSPSCMARPFFLRAWLGGGAEKACSMSVARPTETHAAPGRWPKINLSTRKTTFKKRSRPASPGSPALRLGLSAVTLVVSLGIQPVVAALHAALLVLGPPAAPVGALPRLQQRVQVMLLHASSQAEEGLAARR